MVDPTTIDTTSIGSAVGGLFLAAAAFDLAIEWLMSLARSGGGGDVDD